MKKRVNINNGNTKLSFFPITNFLPSVRLFSLLILTILCITLVSINLLSAQDEPTSPTPNIPIISKLPVDEETGMPESFVKFQETADQLSEEESRKTYLKQEWTKLLADNKIIGGFLFYTDKFFSFFNPLWKYTFGMEFSWSWAFFLSIFIWVVLIIVLYAPSKAFTKFNPILTLIFAIVLACLAGGGGVIPTAVDILSTIITNIWLLVLSIIITILFIVLYTYVFANFGENLKEEAEKEELERSKETIKAHGKVSEKALEEMGRD